MATKRKNYKTKSRKPFWESKLEWILSALKKLILPALALWLIAWLSLGGVFAKTSDALWDGFVSWTADKGLVVADVVVEGRQRVNVMDLQRAIGVKPQDPLLHVDIGHIHDRIAALDWVEDVSVRRNYNGLVTIDLKERVPFVIWDRPGRGKAVVDRTGEVIEVAKVTDFKKLLVVRGVDAPMHAADLLAVMAGEPDLTRYIKGAEWIGSRRWDLMTHDNIRIHLPADDVGFALARLMKAIHEKNILDQPIKSLDLRASDRIIVETEKGSARDLMSLSSSTSSESI
jgi:cell division protein FtsQ